MGEDLLSGCSSIGHSRDNCVRLVGFYQLEQVVGVVWGLHSPWEPDADHVGYTDPAGFETIESI